MPGTIVTSLPGAVKTATSGGCSPEPNATWLKPGCRRSARCGLHEPRPPHPGDDAVRAEAQAEGDQSAEQDPLRAGNVQQLEPAEDERRAERETQDDVGQAHGETAR